jgi:multicomponent Na+:H+ antiporter subunit B
MEIKRHASLRQNVVLRQVSDYLVAPILIFALYVQWHGDFGPGGGFQAGVIFAAGIILYALIHGLARAQRAVPPSAVRICAALGWLLYAGTGVAAMLLGGNFLDYDALAHDPHHGQHWGILIVELGVGITVASVMLSIFYSFAGRRLP